MSDDEYKDSDKSEDEFDIEEYRGIKNIGIILLDICPEMFDDPKPIKKCLAAIHETLDKMLLRNYRRDISVCLLRDDDIILTGLNDNIIDSSKKIMKLLQQHTNDLRTEYERKSTVSLRYVFSECLKQVQNLEKTMPHIVILTVDDDPHKADKTENLSAIDVALSFRDSNVKLVVLPLKENFNYNLFYGELLKAANDVPLELFDGNIDHCYTVEDITNILKSIIKNKVKITRYMFRLITEENKELYFWSQMRHLARVENLYYNYNISSETKNEIKLQYIDEQDCDPNKYLVNFGGATITIEKSDLHRMVEQLPVGFTLLYLTKERQSSDYYFSRNFILQYDETQKIPIKQTLFNDVWHYCRSNKKYMICGFRAAGHRQIPHKIELTAEVFQGKRCFIGEYLVTEDEINVDEPDDDSEEFVSKISKNNEGLQLMCDVIDKLSTNNFNPAQFSCYNYELKSSLIKSQLLDTEVQEVEDCFPTNEEVSNKLGDTDTQLSALFHNAEIRPKKSRKK